MARSAKTTTTDNPILDQFNNLLIEFGELNATVNPKGKFMAEHGNDNADNVGSESLNSLVDLLNMTELVTLNDLDLLFDRFDYSKFRSAKSDFNDHILAGCKDLQNSPETEAKTARFNEVIKLLDSFADVLDNMNIEHDPIPSVSRKTGATGPRVTGSWEFTIHKDGEIARNSKGVPYGISTIAQSNGFGDVASLVAIVTKDENKTNDGSYSFSWTTKRGTEFTVTARSK